MACKISSPIAPGVVRPSVNHSIPGAIVKELKRMWIAATAKANASSANGVMRDGLLIFTVEEDFYHQSGTSHA